MDNTPAIIFSQPHPFTSRVRVASTYAMNFGDIAADARGQEPLLVCAPLRARLAETGWIDRILFSSVYILQVEIRCQTYVIITES